MDIQNKNEDVMRSVQVQTHVKTERHTPLWSENVWDKKLLADLHTDVTTPKNIPFYYSVTENNSTKMERNGVKLIKISQYGVQCWVFVKTN
jgi:hypothetical protein